MISRVFLDNTLDPRFYEPSEQSFVDIAQLQRQSTVQSAQTRKTMLYIIRDPFELLNLFKQYLQHEIEDTYIDFLDEIK